MCSSTHVPGEPAALLGGRRRRSAWSSGRQRKPRLTPPLNITVAPDPPRRQVFNRSREIFSPGVPEGRVLRDAKHRRDLGKSDSVVWRHAPRG